MDLGAVGGGDAECSMEGAAGGDARGTADRIDGVIGSGGNGSDCSTATAADGVEGVLGLGTTVSDGGATVVAGDAAAVVGVVADGVEEVICSAYPSGGGVATAVDGAADGVDGAFGSGTISQREEPPTELRVHAAWTLAAMLRVPALLWPVLRLSELAIHLVTVLPTMAMPTKLCSA